VLVSKSADAVMCEEPFASRAVSAGLARSLFSAQDMKKSSSNIGGTHLRAVVSHNPVLAGKGDQARLVVQMVQRSLQWLAKAKPTEVVDVLKLSDPAEGKELVNVLSNNAGIFSPDGRFSAKSIAGTVLLLQKLGSIDQATELDKVIDDQWVGRSA
jgi:ABC-type nitrate/sulfonate/bicarbonate transport system substrate-binding protein